MENKIILHFIYSQDKCHTNDESYVLYYTDSLYSRTSSFGYVHVEDGDEICVVHHTGYILCK